MIATRIAPPTAAPIIIFAAVERPPVASFGPPDRFSPSHGSSREDIVGGAALVPLVLVIAALVVVPPLDEPVVEVTLCVVVDAILVSVVDDVLSSLVEAVLSVVVIDVV